MPVTMPVTVTVGPHSAALAQVEFTPGEPVGPQLADLFRAMAEACETPGGVPDAAA